MLITFFLPLCAHAQACCASSSAVAPGRLEPGERFLAGTQPVVSAGIGSFDAERRFRRNESGASQIDARLTAFATLRVLRPLQVGLTVPFVASFRRSANAGPESGGGVGDLGMSFRYDVLGEGDRRSLPGVGIVGGVTAPTGRGPENSQAILGSDATGLGVWQWSAGPWLEKTFGDWMLTAAGWVGLRSRADLGPFHSQLAPQWNALFALGYNITRDIAAAALITYTAEGDARVDGERAPASGRSQTRFGASATWAWARHSRLVMSGFVDPPITGLGKNQIASAGALFTLLVTVPERRTIHGFHQDCAASSLTRSPNP